VTHGEVGRVEILRVWPETQGGAGVVFPHFGHHFQIRHLLTVGKGHIVLLPIPLNPHLQVLGEGIHHRHANPVQTARKSIVLVGELAASMQFGQNHLHTRPALLWMHIHWHATTIICDLQGAILVQGDINGGGKPGHGLIDTVVDHLLSHMIRAAGVCIHARALANWIQTTQDLNGGGIVGAITLSVSVCCKTCRVYTHRIDQARCP